MSTEIIKNEYRELDNVLLSYFHPDIDNLQTGITDLLSEDSIEALENFLKDLNRFFKDESISESDKSEYLKSILWHEIPKEFSDHLSWLKHVAKHIEDHLKNISE